MKDLGVDGDPKNMRAERLAAMNAAENALKAKENEIGKMDRKTNSSDNAPDPSTIKNEIIAVQTKSSQDLGQKESEHQGAAVELNTTHCHLTPSKLRIIRSIRTAPTKRGSK